MEFSVRGAAAAGVDVCLLFVSSGNPVQRRYSGPSHAHYTLFSSPSTAIALILMAWSGSKIINYKCKMHVHVMMCNANACTYIYVYIIHKQTQKQKDNYYIYIYTKTNL